MTATIPFDFYVGAVKLPAGVYTISTVDGGGSVVRLSDGKGHQNIAMTLREQNRGTGKRGELIFHRYDDVHFLSEVRWTGSTDSRVLSRSSMEIRTASAHAAKQVAAGAVQNR